MDDVRAHEKETAMEHEAKKRAQRLLKSCLEDQMRERNMKSKIDRVEQAARNGIIIDRMKQLEIDHSNKVRYYLENSYIEKKILRVD